MKSNVVRIPDPNLVDHYLEIRIDVKYDGSEEAEPVYITLKTYREIVSICDIQSSIHHEFTIEPILKSENVDKPRTLCEAEDEPEVGTDYAVELLKTERNQFYYMVHNCCYQAKCGQPCECSSEPHYIRWISELERLDSLLLEMDPYSFENSDPVSTS